MLNLLLFVFCATFATGQTPEKCHECSSKEWKKCVGHDHVCRISERCVSAAALITQELPGQSGAPVKKVTEVNKVARRCADRSLCEKDFSVDFRVAKWNIKSTCGTNATVGNENVPRGRLTCYSCISEPYYCTKTEKCGEKETMCISASETVAGNLVVSKGCATETMCKLRKHISEVIGPTVVGHVTCCQGDLCNGVLKSTSSVFLLFLSLLLWMLP